MSTAESFLNAGTDARRFAPVAVPLEHGTYHVRKLPSADMDRYAAAIKDQPTERKRAFILATALCDETGRRLFPESSRETLDALAQVVTPDADAVIDAWQDANGLNGPKR